MASIEHVLHPTDLSEDSERAFGQARQLAERFGARLTLYHALVSEVDLYDTEASEKARADAAETAVRGRLESLVHEAAAPHDIIVERNAAVPVFADVAVLSRITQLQPDVTVMATHSRPGASGFFVGTVAEEVVRLSPRPVLVVRKGARDTAAPYRRILVTTDLSAASQSAFAWSRLLAERFSAEVIALHVSARPADSERQTEELRQFVAPHHQGVSLLPLVTHGRPWKEITAVAQRREVDLIVMATRGHDSIADEMLGSNTDRVLRSAPCPVWVAR
jgi:nucleotide-binding universal stress UspA family protein